MQRTSTDFANATVFRWFVHTDQGRKVVWAPDEQSARERATAKGLVVSSVEPSDA